MHVLYCIKQYMKMKTPRSQFCTCISVSNKTYMYVTLDNFSYRFLYLYFTKKTKNTLGPTFTYMCTECIYPGPFFSFAPILPLYRCCFLLPWVLEVLLLSREGKVSHDTNSLQSSCIKCTRSKFPAEALKDITQIN